MVYCALGVFALAYCASAASSTFFSVDAWASFCLALISNVAMIFSFLNNCYLTVPPLVPVISTIFVAESSTSMYKTQATLNRLSGLSE